MPNREYYYQKLLEYEALVDLYNSQGLSTAQKAEKEVLAKWLFSDGVYECTLSHALKAFPNSKKIIAIKNACEPVGLDYNRVIVTNEADYYYVCNQFIARITMKFGLIEFHCLYNNITMDVFISNTTNRIVDSRIYFEDDKANN